MSYKSGSDLNCSTPPNWRTSSRGQIRRELDFALEGRQYERFRDHFASDPGIFIPKVYWEYTTERLLTIDYIDGVKSSDLEGMARAGIDRREIARRAATAFLKQVMIHGYFHGDPHPGNLFVLPGNRLWFVDFGIVGRLTDEAKDDLAELFVGMIRRDSRRVIRAMTRLGSVGDLNDAKALRAHVEDLIDRHYGISLKEVHAATVFNEALELANRHHIRLPPDLLLLGKALLAIEGMGERLDPDFNVLEIAEPFARELAGAPFQPQAPCRAGGLATRRVCRHRGALARQGRSDTRSGREGASHNPLSARRARPLQSPPRSDFKPMAAVAVVTASLVIGSSFVVLNGPGPILFGIPGR